MTEYRDFTEEQWQKYIESIGELKYITWKDICQPIHGCQRIQPPPIQYTRWNVHPDHDGLSINGRLPHSISEAEFNLMRDFIVDNNLKTGFDLATGTGISAIAFGFGFKQTGGKLLSVDSYIEESTQYQNGEWGGFEGDVDMALNSPLAEGAYNNNIQIIRNLFNLDNVTLEKGVSPHDCVHYIEKHKLYPIDFVFFDCPKSAEDFHRDATYIKKYLNQDKYAIFWHDTHCFMDDFKKLSKEYFGIESRQITKFNCDGELREQEFPLSVITNIEYSKWA